MGDVHTSLCRISNGDKLLLSELVKGNLMCLPRGHELQKCECNLRELLPLTNLFLRRKDKTSSPRCPRRLCQIDGDKAAKVDGCLDLFLVMWLVMG